MAKNETKRLRPIQLQADQDALTAIQALSDYQPANALASARDTAIAAEWDLHNTILVSRSR